MADRISLHIGVYSREVPNEGEPRYVLKSLLLRKIMHSSSAPANPFQAYVKAAYSGRVNQLEWEEGLLRPGSGLPRQ